MTRASRGRRASEWKSGRPPKPVAGRGKTAPPRVPPSRATAAVSGRTTAARVVGLLADWSPAVGRALLGLVLAWFGYHELVQPGLWTGYVPVASSGSDTAVLLVLAHGWVLLVVAVALIVGIVPRAAAAIAAVLLAEVVISLVISAGLSDLVIRDIGVLGLAICLTGSRQRAVLLR